MLGVMRSAFSGSDEKNKSRILQPYRQPRADAEIRALVPGCVSVHGKGAHAHGPGSRRGLHEYYSARLSFAGRSVDLAFDGRIAPLHPAAPARLRQANAGT